MPQSGLYLIGHFWHKRGKIVIFFDKHSDLGANRKIYQVILKT